MVNSVPITKFWLEFRLLSDGLETTAARAMPLTTWHAASNPVFRLFPMLPTELRLSIWELLIVPRMVGIACFSEEDGDSFSVERQRDKLWGSHPSIMPSTPALLHVNREARRLALTHYELSFEWKVPLVLAGADMNPPPSATIHPPIMLPHTHHPAAPQSNGHDNVETPQPTPSPSTNLNHDTSDPSSSSAGNGVSAVPGNTRPSPPTSSPPRTWFNFALDTVYLLGELEPCDSFGVTSPMTYFIPSHTTSRVRKAAVPLRALGFGETGRQQIFSALYHVVDRFAPPDGRILVCVTARDEFTPALLGNDRQLTRLRTWEWGFYLDGLIPLSESLPSTGRAVVPDPDGNVVQKIWRDFYRGSIVTSALAKMQFVLVDENELEQHVRNWMVATPPMQNKKGQK